MVFRELSFFRLECGVHDRLHIYPLCGIFYFPWHRHQIEGTNGFYCLIRKTERFTISNVESQVFTPNNSRLDPGSNPGCPRDKRMSYHWTNCASAVRSESGPSWQVAAGYGDINTAKTVVGTLQKWPIRAGGRSPKGPAVTGRGDQGKLSHFAIKSTMKPMYQQILENEYCIWYKKYLHVCVSNMNCTGLAIIT